MNKSAIVKSLRAQLKAQYKRSIAALDDARDGATGDDAKAEGKYDTRGLEASYLAAGQAEQAEELGRGVSAMEAFEFPDFDFDDPIGRGTLIEADSDGDIVYYLLAPAGGGLTCESEDGETITVIGPASPLSGKLIGQKVGKILDDPPLMILEVF